MQKEKYYSVMQLCADQEYYSEKLRANFFVRVDKEKGRMLMEFIPLFDRWEECQRNLEVNVPYFRIGRTIF